jgi:hypothetical protein
VKEKRSSYNGLFVLEVFHFSSFIFRGLENTLKMNRFKIEGNLKNSENKKLLAEFFSDQNDQQILGLEGSLDYPVEIESQELRTSIRSMEFFDRLATEGAEAIWNSLLYLNF